jgi:RNA polymerase sigma-70 factor (ECF subfamily)
VGSARVGHAEWTIQADRWEWDPALFEVFGYSEQVAPGWPALLALKHPDDLASTLAVRGSIQAGKGFSYANRIFRKDGWERKLRAVGSVALDSKDLPGMMNATIEVLSAWEHPLSGVEISRASDGELMLALRAQVPEALAEAVRRHSSNVSRVARRLLHGNINADDVVGDVFERLFRSPERFDARRGSLASYLSMEARARCIDLGRSEASRHRRELNSGRFALAHAVADEELATVLRLDLWASLRDLAPNERVPIELAYLNGLSYRSVAEHLGLPEGTVKARIRTGLQRLRSAMGAVAPV